MEKKKSIIVALIAFFWFFIIVLGYFVTHKPISPNQIGFFLSQFWKIILVVWVISIAGGLGKRIFQLTKISIHNLWYLESALGLGALAILVLVIGSVWKINTIVILVILGLFSLLFFRNIKDWISEYFQIIKNTNAQTNFSMVLLGFLVIIFLTQLFVSLAPATRYDALNYHLTLPKAYLLQERITDLPWLVMSGMPQIAEMLYIILLALGGESAVLIMNWFIGILIVFGLLGFLDERIDNESNWMAVVSLFSGYTFASALSWGYVDLFSAFFGLGVVIFFVNFLQTKEKKFLLFSGVFSGLAFGCKYPAGVIFLSILLTLIVVLRKLNIKTILKPIGFFCLGAAMLAFPWLVKNLLFTGNPIYPFFFESGSMNQIRLDVYQGLAPYGNLLDLFFLPIRATIMGVESAHGYSVSTGPLLLGLGILAFIDWENKPDDHKRLISIVGLIAFFGILIWAIGNQFSGFLIQTRFYFVLFPTFAILAAYGYSQIAHYSIGQVRIKRLGDSLVILVLAFNSFQLVSEMVEKDVLANVFGYSTKQDFLEKNLGWYARAISGIDALEPDSKVLMLYEPRGFGCIPNCDPDEILDHWKTIYHQIDSNDKIISAWMNDGFTHILVYTKGMEFLREDQDPHHPAQELDALENLLVSLDLVENYGNWYHLFVLEPE